MFVHLSYHQSMQLLLRMANSKTRIFLQVKRKKNRPDGNVGVEKEDIYGEKRTRGNTWITIAVVCIRLHSSAISFPRKLSYVSSV